jgi:hypothetical protein
MASPVDGGRELDYQLPSNAGPWGPRSFLRTCGDVPVGRRLSVGSLSTRVLTEEGALQALGRMVRLRASVIQWSAKE